jgi:hypothetical protein
MTTGASHQRPVWAFPFWFRFDNKVGTPGHDLLCSRDIWDPGSIVESLFEAHRQPLVDEDLNCDRVDCLDVGFGRFAATFRLRL